ncbi:MAG: SufD family Fe-S cluster assembly protein [Proteobacteria bacterium]|nr:SufD family Fe-S cluster assembly protein [Pseudomonadota bacterium]
MKRAEILKLNGHVKYFVNEDVDLILDLFETSETSHLEIVFEKEGVSCHLIGLYVLNEGEKLDFKTSATHKVRNTSCLQDVRGVLKNNSESKYIGSIIIEENASLTESFLDDGVLVLGTGTKNQADPILEIRNNDVKASHGSTTGRINGEEVFYLMARGLSKTEAENIIVEGFFEKLLNQIEDEDARNLIAEKLQTKLNN